MLTETETITAPNRHRHIQYREGLLEKLRQLLVANPGISLAGARAKLRPLLSEDDIDLLFDNWLNANFDRFEVTSGPNSVTAKLVPRFRQKSADERAEEKRRRDRIASRVEKDHRENMFQSFASHIWDTILPNGVTLRKAKGRDLKHAQGWYAALAKVVKPTESVYKKLTTRELFNIAQRG